MPSRQNPLKLNTLQLRTLAVLQALSRLSDSATPGPGPGESTIERFPKGHGDHIHLGEVVVSTRETTGLYIESVWHALERKGLARADWPHRITLTAAGSDYDTGMAALFGRSPH